MYHFGHLQNFVKVFQMNKNGVKYALQKWIISHPNLIWSPIENDNIKVRFDYGKGGVQIELGQRVLL